MSASDNSAPSPVATETTVPARPLGSAAPEKIRGALTRYRVLAYITGIWLLVLCGEMDGPDYPKQAKHIAETIPNGQLFLIPKVGHVPLMQVPDIFYRELMKFLNAGS